MSPMLESLPILIPVIRSRSVSAAIRAISLDGHPEMVGNCGNPIAILDKAGRSALEATLKLVQDSLEPKT
jgi:hypothetical protein